jgi:hypothetical protein
MTTAELTVPEEQDETFVALTPAELPAAQHGLIEWCERKVKALEAEAKDLDEHRIIAKSNGWKLSTIERNLALARRRVLYYGKMKQALEAGYLLVPNMPVDVFAVRVSRETPRAQAVSENSWQPRAPQATAEALPAEEGRYVGGALALRRESWQRKDENGSAVDKYQWWADEFTDVDFPVKAVKPVVLENTARALGLRLFDQIGIVRDNGVQRNWPRRGDPIVVGQLIDPRGQGRGTSFFVAWWLDTSTL